MTLTIVITITGSIFSLLFIVIGYFLKTVHNDVRINTSDNGKLKGKVELLEQKSSSDLKLMQEMTQMELRTMASSISILSANVNSLVMVLAKQNIITKSNDIHE